MLDNDYDDECWDAVCPICGQYCGSNYCSNCDESEEDEDEE